MIWLQLKLILTRLLRSGRAERLRGATLTRFHPRRLRITVFIWIKQESVVEDVSARAVKLTATAHYKGRTVLYVFKLKFRQFSVTPDSSVYRDQILDQILTGQQRVTMRVRIKWKTVLNKKKKKKPTHREGPGASVQISALSVFASQ